ncbi:MAG: adenosylcobinamide-phosphate synthase CbiB [Lachnospiraceae bacterium]|nr:adenosylcobinamide-phosphate synthase CbiB [Lachnospiraceae bacterium]
MKILAAAAAGFLLDLLLGDPEGFPHPVVLMGAAITKLEKTLRASFPDTPEGRRRGGFVLAALLSAGTFFISFGLLKLLGHIHPALGFIMEVIFCWQALAMRCLKKESENVRRKLISGTIEEARSAVGRIVGRDVAALDEAGVTRAAVETVAENFSDGEIAPLFYMLIGGAPLALCYKAVNTMDSMVGYKNERYIDFGRAAAKLDDAANYIPSRLSALLLIAAAPFAGLDGRNAFHIWRRDRQRHASPNSAQTEAAMAGALKVRLAGPASYFGRRLEKPYIGDPERPIEPEDIRRADRLMYAAGFLGFLLLGAIRLAFIFAG